MPSLFLKQFAKNVWSQLVCRLSLKHFINKYLPKGWKPTKHTVGSIMRHLYAKNRVMCVSILFPVSKVCWSISWVCIWQWHKAWFVGIYMSSESVLQKAIDSTVVLLQSVPLVTFSVAHWHFSDNWVIRIPSIIIWNSFVLFVKLQPTNLPTKKKKKKKTTKEQIKK